MRVNLNFNPNKNTLINSARVNASFAKYNTEGEKASGNQMRSDRVTLSPQGKLMSMIENLTKQKEALVERKNDLVESTLDGGGKLEDIKDQLKSYKKQIEAIDKQISNAYTQQAKESVEQDDKKKSGKADKTKTREQVEAERFSSLAGISQDIKHAEKISAIREHVEGEARIKETEAEIAGVHVDVLESKELNGDTVGDMIENEESAISRKEKEIDQLWDKASELSASQGEKIRESREELEETKESGENTEKLEESGDGMTVDHMAEEED